MPTTPRPSGNRINRGRHYRTMSGRNYRDDDPGFSSEQDFSLMNKKTDAAEMTDSRLETSKNGSVQDGRCGRRN